MENRFLGGVLIWKMFWYSKQEPHQKFNGHMNHLCFISLSVFSSLFAQSCRRFNFTPVLYSDASTAQPSSIPKDDDEALRFNFGDEKKRKLFRFASEMTFISRDKTEIK